LASQIGVVAVVQSVGATHCTHPPLAVSQTPVPGKFVQSPELAQPSQMSVMVLQTGAVIAHPVIAHVGTTQL
jgi:hypothetical protein